MQRVSGLGKARDRIGLGIVVAAIAAVIAYRAAFIEPRAWGAICAAAAPPFACAPRTAVLWLQQKYLWGSVALALGMFAYLRQGPFWVAVAAIAVGAAAVEFYNATWGMAGLALGAWAWVDGRAPRMPRGNGSAGPAS